MPLNDSDPWTARNVTSKASSCLKQAPFPWFLITLHELIVGTFFTKYSSAWNFHFLSRLPVTLPLALRFGVKHSLFTSPWFEFSTSSPRVTHSSTIAPKISTSIEFWHVEPKSSRLSDFSSASSNFSSRTKASSHSWIFKATQKLRLSRFVSEKSWHLNPKQSLSVALWIN